jgi:rod shape-determining protein MreC
MRRLTRRQQLSATILSVLALLFISLDFTGGSLADSRSGVTGALGSLYRGTDAVIGPARRFVQGVPDVAGNRQQLATLQQQNRALRSQLAAAEADRTTAAKLDALQLQADSRNWKVMPARVIATGPGAGFQWTVTVDAGSREHVLTGQTVTDGFGLVGRVIAVHQTTSVILLAADPTSGIGVRDSRSGELLLATGHGAAGVTASPLDDQVDVKRGDHLLTGPAGKTTYADGIELGTVTSVQTRQDGSTTVQVKPVANPQGLDLVGIVLVPARTTARQPIVPGESG